jgi:hypothetical protein
VERPSWAPEEVDLERPSAARVYDYYLGGSHNFAVDRQLAKQAMQLMPVLPSIMEANRAFLRRAVRFMVEQGVRQFLDLGSGIPTVGHAHEVAQRADPAARVAYVDIDPVAVAHSRSLLADNDQVVVVQADLRDPEQILGHAPLRELLDLREPVGVLMVAVLHFVADEADPSGIIASYRDAVVPGSYLAISHGTHEADPSVSERMKALYARSAQPLTSRSRQQVQALFAGFELVEPGVVHLPQWRPDPDEHPEGRPEQFSTYVGVGRRR